MSSGTRCTNWAFPVCCPFEVSPDDGGILAAAKGVTTGQRYGRFYNATPDTLVEIKWNFVNPIATDFLYIANTSCIDFTNLNEIRLQRSTDDIIWNTEVTITAPYTFVGPQGSDILECFATSSAFQYWRVQFEFAIADTVVLSKIYFGELFDIGVEPDADMQEQRSNRFTLAEQRTTSANVQRTRRRKPAYEYDISYTAIPDSNTIAFLDKVHFNRNTYAVLINTQYTEMLNEHSAIHGQITDVEVEKTSNDLNDISFTFTEMVG